MVKSITGIVTWLKGWFFDKDEITSKEQALQTQINNKASTSDLNTTNGNITNLSNNKADKINGASQITDNNSNDYSNIGNLSSGASQQSINSNINNALGELKNIKLYEVVSTRPTASASTMNKLYFVVKAGGSGEDSYNVYYTIKDGSTYKWEKIDDFDLQNISINWSAISDKPSNFTPSSHLHGNITNDGKLTVDASAIKKAVVTDNNDNISVVSVDKLNCGTFAELQSLINATSNGGTVILNKDYKNAGSENSIKISKPLNIIGNGHIIDADNKSSIFEVTGTGGNNCVISDVYFINGQTDAGGAIHCGLSAHIIRNCVFNNNVANRNGGAIFSSDNYNLSTKIENCLFNNNSAGQDGGAIYADKNDVIIDCIFNNNTATGDGGGICCIYYSLTVIGCKFTNSTLYNVTNKDYLTDHQSLSGYLTNGDAVTSISLVPKSEDATGAIQLFYGDES